VSITRNSKGDPKGVRTAPGGPEAIINIKMTELVQQRYPEMPGVYNLMSGVTHGMPYMLSDSAAIANRRAEWDPVPIDVGASVLASMHATHTMLAAHAWHRGCDETAVPTAKTRIAAVDEIMRQFGRHHMQRPLADPLAPFGFSRAKGVPR
jgi:hypothetical protein